MGITKVEDVMTADVVTVSTDTPFKDVVRAMHDRGVSGVPVVDAEGRLLGIVTEADLLRAEQEGLEPRRRKPFLEWFVDRRLLEKLERRGEDLRAGDIMTGEVVTVGPRNSVREAIKVLLEAGVKRLPVTDGEGRVVGVVSRGDLLSPFLRTDEEIRREIAEVVIWRGMWADPHGIVVGVDRGVATLSGEVENEAEKTILLDVVRRVDGVVGIEDRLTYRAGSGKGPRG